MRYDEKSLLAIKNKWKFWEYSIMNQINKHKVSNDVFIKKINQIIQRTIKEKNIGVKKLAYKSGLSESKIYNIKNQKDMNVTTLKLLCDALEIDMAFLLNSASEYSSTRIGKINTALIGRSDEFLTVILQIIKFLKRR